jgi:putative transposase
MKLTNRTYTCPECGLTIDRDVNAAKNIKSFALRDIIKNLDTDATSGINACGVESSGLGGLTTQTKLSTVKQENLREV